MKLPIDIAFWLQSRLRVLACEDRTCAFFIRYPTETATAPSAEEWQLSVEAIFRCLKSGLIVVGNYLGCRDDDAFLSAIRTLSPFRPEGGMLWNGTFIYGGDRLLTLIERYFPNPGANVPTLNEAFASELADIFAAAGVPWSNQPLAPIAENNALSSRGR